MSGVGRRRFWGSEKEQINSSTQPLNLTNTFLRFPSKQTKLIGKKKSLKMIGKKKKKTYWKCQGCQRGNLIEREMGRG